MDHTTESRCAADVGDDTTARREAGPAGDAQAGSAGLLWLMCAWCRRMKDDDGGWGATTRDVSERSISHGICPECEAQTLDAAERSRSGSAATGAPQARSRPLQDDRD